PRDDAVEDEPRQVDGRDAEEHTGDDEREQPHLPRDVDAEDVAEERHAADGEPRLYRAAPSYASDFRHLAPPRRCGTTSILRLATPGGAARPAGPPRTRRPGRRYLPPRRSERFPVPAQDRSASRPSWSHGLP